MFARIIDPTRKLLARCYRTSRIVGETEIHHINLPLRRLGHEIVFHGARQICDSFIAAIIPRTPGMAGHDIGIDINRVNRIGDRDFVLMSKDIQDVAAIAFRSVRDENLIVTDVDSSVAIIRLRDFAPQEFVALFWAVAAKCFADAELLHRLLHCGDGNCWQWLRHVADSAPD